MKITKAIIPAAGLGTRFLPATKSQPKEMLPIVDKPCIQYLVEEAVASGIKEIIIITGRGKRSIEDHFDHSHELDAHLSKNGKKREMKAMERIEKMAKFIYVRQPFPNGDGNAILCAKELINEPVAVLFGDDIWDSKTPPLAQMIAQFEKLQAPIIALHRINKKDSDKYGMVAPASPLRNGVCQIKTLIEKPSPKKSPSSLAISGKYIITPDLIKTLERSSSHSKDSELRLIDGMIEYVKNKPIYGCEIEGKRFDTGDKLGYLHAVIHFASRHPELASDFKKLLKTLDFG